MVAEWFLDQKLTTLGAGYNIGEKHLVEPKRIQKSSCDENV